MPQTERRLPVVVIVAAFIAAGATAYWLVTPTSDVPAPGSTDYEAAARSFYRGVAGLQVGLLDGAIEDFTNAASAAEGEPAIWANLGLTHLRLGAFDPAAAALERATALAPDDSAILFLRSRLEAARGNRDAAVSFLRQAVELDPADMLARTALVEEIESAAGPEADAEAQRLLEDVVRQQPDNLAVLVERARLAAKRGDTALLQDSMARLTPLAAGWPDEVVEQFRVVEQAAADPGAADPALELAFLRNVLARVPAYLEGRRAVTASVELIADPFLEFLRMVPVRNTPADADRSLTYVADLVGEPRPAPWQALLSVSLDGEQPPALFVADASEVRRVGGNRATFPFPGGDAAIAPSPNGLLALDWNHDFLMDLVLAGAGGVRLYLQAPDGTFADATSTASASSGDLGLSATGAWAADVEMDGDLDIVVGLQGAESVVLRNNGNGEWEAQRPFAGPAGLRSFAWADIDDDGDPDAVMLDAAGGLHVSSNLQAGMFAPLAPPSTSAGLAGMTLADADADGRVEVVTVDRAGTVRLAEWTGESWNEAEWTQGTAVPESAELRPIVADLDNNGALDLLLSGADVARVWLAGPDLTLVPLETGVEARRVLVADLDSNGLLDLAGLVDGRPARLTGRATAGYHYQVIRPRAQGAAGDQRINTFGIGGAVEVRSGLLVQKQIIAGPIVHVGLGSRTTVDVTRIVWPNGVPQAEFDPAVDQPIAAEQRLKGSCPWIFADDGTGLRFVTDFLWRSPLGLRINAQATAGVTQTEDWVKIRGDQLAARDGIYDIRISAELWETHFVDHVSLMVVDHPDDVEVFVDERFVPGAPPALAVNATGRLVPVANARDQQGRDVTEIVARRDDQFLSTFALGRYQGVAEDHFVEFDVATPIRADVPSWIVAHGWIYPTDSSINMAIGQGGHVVPTSLALDAQDASGEWITVASDLGFPAGKNKTVLIDLRPVARAGLRDARRLRLRTNLEIYWDQVATAEAAGADVRTERLAPSGAELRYRGFSQTSVDRRELPERPDYARLATTTPRWRDLTGYYTRFGDVRELVDATEDRYVIMNAGDELRLRFAAPPPPADGWTRDFVLVGDGWVKDGDFNTVSSKTVLPLPAHQGAQYESSVPSPVLEADPVYQRHAGDWQTFHTRYVTPEAFLQGLGASARSDRHP